MKARNLLIGFSLICVGPSPAFAVPLNGGVVDFYQFFTGTLSPVEVDVGSGPVSTGLISYNLDTTNPSAQQFAFNFSSLTATAQLDLNVNFPLLQSLGASPLKIHIAESGPIVSGVPDLPVGSNENLTFRSLLTGGGTVGPGSLFSGFAFNNINDTTTVKNVNVAPGGTFTQTVTGGGNITLTATITQPGKPPVPTGGTGTFGLGPSARTILNDTARFRLGSACRLPVEKDQIAITLDSAVPADSVPTALSAHTFNLFNSALHSAGLFIPATRYPLNG